MNKLYMTVLTLLIIILSVCVSNADWYGQSYWVAAGTKRTVAWTAEPDAVGYELQIRRIENGKTVYQARVAGTQLGITWKTPGHYVAYVRWYKLIGTTNTFGEWKNSLEHDSSLVLVGGVLKQRAWMIIVPTNY